MYRRRWEAKGIVEDEMADQNGYFASYYHHYNS
jgi:hypothetical protein